MKANKLIYTEIKRRGSEPSLSAGKNYKTKKIPCKLILYGDFLFLVHSKNKHIFSLESSGYLYPHALTAYITGLLLTVYVVRIKKIALIHALILSQCFEVYFHINYLFSATYHFLIDRFDLI